MAHVSVRRLREEQILINCPACGALGTPAICWDEQESVNFIWRLTNTWASCESCGAKLFSKWRCADLVDRSPDELDGVIVVRKSLISRFITIAALALCWAPFIGLVLSICALIANRAGGRWKKASIIALVISSLITALAVVGMLITDK